jgi:hypothetical protein
MHCLRVTRRFYLSAALLVATVLTAPAAQGAEYPEDGQTLDFAVERNGAEIGYHRIRFVRAGERLRVDVEVSVRVTVMLVPVYRFTHRAQEVWEGGRLVALDAETDDDGEPHRLSVRADGDGLAVTHNGERTRVAAGLIPTSLWNRATTEQGVLLNTLRGEAMPTQVTRLGTKAVSTGGGEVTAEGFFVDASPDYKRSVWYDGTGRVVAVQLTGDDGSLVTYRLR